MQRVRTSKVMREYKNIVQNAYFSIQSEKRLYESLKEQAYKVGGQNSELYYKNGSNIDTTNENIVRFLDYEHKRKKTLEIMEREYRTVQIFEEVLERALQEDTPRIRLSAQIIRYKFITGLEIKQIAAITGYNIQYIYELARVFWKYVEQSIDLKEAVKNMRSGQKHT